MAANAPLVIEDRISEGVLAAIDYAAALNRNKGSDAAPDVRGLVRRAFVIVSDLFVWLEAGSEAAAVTRDLLSLRYQLPLDESARDLD